MWRRLCVDVDLDGKVLGASVEWKNDDGRTCEVLVLDGELLLSTRHALAECEDAIRAQSELPFG